jgi:hypothetical protein
MDHRKYFRSLQSDLMTSVIITLAITLHFIPYFLLGENFPITIFDNLDSNIVWNKILLTNDLVFSLNNNQVSQIMNGCSSLSISTDISLIFFKLFGMYWGLIANKVIVTLTAFFGMYFLLKEYIIPSASNIFLKYTALLFCLIPFWSFTLSVAGAPFVFYAFLDIRNNKNFIRNILILLIYSFYSSLVLSTIFILSILFLITLRDFLKKKSGVKWSFLALALFTAFNLASHLPLIYGFIMHESSVSHRTEFQLDSLNFTQSLNKAIKLFTSGQVHAFSGQLFMLPCFFIGIYFLTKKRDPILLYAILFLLITSLFYGFIHWSIFRDFFQKISQIIPIQLQRFYFLHPLFWFIIFAKVTSKLMHHEKIGKPIVYLLFISSFCFIIKQNEAIKNRAQPSFKEFYAADLFEIIKSQIQQPNTNFRVLCIGFHPAVAQYNGFYTLDGYLPTYPIEYKHQFRKVIEGELNKNDDIKKYFDRWGSRCYAFTDDIGKDYHPGKKLLGQINSLEFNFEQIKHLGGSYIISAKEISPSIKELQKITDIKIENRIYNFFIYKIL